MYKNFTLILFIYLKKMWKRMETKRKKSLGENDQRPHIVSKYICPEF